MSFERLAPLVQHHIVNALGWTQLRPVQERSISPILDGENVIVLARTAGGKTEAAFFPVLSRQLEEQWTGLSVLYLSPIRALLNNQVPRLQQYFTWIGRRAEVWHGDTPEGSRRKVRRTPPDCLLTTPESLEALLISTRIDPAVFFADLQVVVIDEIHAFAGDDRGWHLLAVLERLAALAGRDLQRIGLSATVGNHRALVEWMAGSSSRPRRTIEPEGQVAVPDVTLDYVGSLDNAALLITKLHAGEKRLVFCDSRLHAELMAAALRQRGVNTFITHSSLPVDDRTRAEQAFREARDCVIVATSALELGIDVGDLDRVIQIDAPGAVASFLQRMGRTGRRAGTVPNCLFLATDDDAVLRAAGLIHLWKQGFVESAKAPPLPLHVMAQQCLALVLQHRALARDRFEQQVAGLALLLHIPPEMLQEMIAFLFSDGWLWQDGAQVSIGPKAEGELGHRHFMELLSVFTSPPLFQVLHGRTEVGFVHVFSFTPRAAGEVLLVLAGRYWEVTHVDWSRRLAQVKPATSPGKSRWVSRSVGRSLELCEAMRQVLLGQALGQDCWSKRTQARLEEQQAELSWLEPDVHQLIDQGDGLLELWTFAGSGCNRLLAAALQARVRAKIKTDDLCIRLELASDEKIETVLQVLHSLPETLPSLTDDELKALEAAKFSTCLPPSLRRKMLVVRFGDAQAYGRVRAREVRGVRISEHP